MTRHDASLHRTTAFVSGWGRLRRGFGETQHGAGCSDELSAPQQHSGREVAESSIPPERCLFTRPPLCRGGEEVAALHNYTIRQREEQLTSSEPVDVLSSLDAAKRRRAVNKVYCRVALRQGFT
ncbi:hypothetical protein EYF80_017308 [Liparis tanakae]|uniref:Uncharacterized protein n=1 Tax=Liparis tanakae TaxID=230148 RepID=A0A4Z2I5H8_9TELE|nr:hypothetical protein EYF80_017308 [Liparis tanakae]